MAHSTSQKIAIVILLASAVTGCSIKTVNRNEFAIPVPKSDKVAPFDLSKASSRYDINAATSNYDLNAVATDPAGNVYMLDGRGPRVNVLRMSQNGPIDRIAKFPNLAMPYGIAYSKRSLLVGSRQGLYRVTLGGGIRQVGGRQLDRPYPIGARPDGSDIVLSGNTVWSINGSKATSLYKSPHNLGYRHGAVASNGTVYVQNGESIGRTLVLEARKKPRLLTPHGALPDAKREISTLTENSISPASDGGFYARAATNPGTSVSGPGYIVHVSPSGAASVLAKGSMGNASKNCKTSMQYSAMENDCALPWFVAQSGRKILVMGTPAEKSIPAIALRADAK